MPVATCQVDDDGIATITLDDGALNILTLQMFADLSAALDDAADARALVLAGRDGSFSTGLDLKHVMAHGVDGARELGRVLGEVAMRIWADPRPVVAAATGHALAGGTILAIAADHVVAADAPDGDGEYWWGLIETVVGLELPDFALAPARHRLTLPAINRWVLPGVRVNAARALEVGYADELLPAGAVVERAHDEARLRLELPQLAYAGTKRRLRSAEAARVLANLDADLEAAIAPVAAMVGG